MAVTKGELQGLGLVFAGQPFCDIARGSDVPAGALDFVWQGQPQVSAIDAVATVTADATDEATAAVGSAPLDFVPVVVTDEPDVRRTSGIEIELSGARVRVSSTVDPARSRSKAVPRYSRRYLAGSRELRRFLRKPQRERDR